MEQTGWRFKRNNINFITDLQVVQCLLILFGLFNLSLCLFEDQIGKFDWKQNYVGKLKFSHFDTVSTAKKIIVATEENVVAALHLKTGQIIWRQVLERTQQEQMQFLHVEGSETVTVSGRTGIGPFLVRGWDTGTGRIQWQWSLTPLTAMGADRKTFWFSAKGNLFHVIAVTNSHLEVTVYSMSTGQKGRTQHVSTNWITDIKRCVLTAPYFACISEANGKKKLTSVDLASDSNVVHSLSLDTVFSEVNDVSLSKMISPEPTVVLKQGNISKLVLVTPSGYKFMPLTLPASASLIVIPSTDNNLVLCATHSDKMFKVTANVLETGESVPSAEVSMQYPDHYGQAEISSALCYARGDRGTACRFLLSTEDHSTILLQSPDKFLWVREESLAKIVAVNMLDLPVSDLDAAIETEFDNKENGNIIGMVTRRLTSQVIQLRTALLTILGSAPPPSTSQAAGLVRDEFGLHKMIVAVTSAGKIFGIDNKNGEIIWQKRIENIEPFTTAGKSEILLIVQRTTRHFPHIAQCSLLAKDKITSEGVLFTFNPVSGQELNGGVRRLGYIVKQTLLLPEGDDTALRGIVLLDSSGYVHVEPSSTKPVLLRVADRTYMYTVDQDKGILTGYTLLYSTDEKLAATPTWKLKLGSQTSHIIEITGKDPSERVHSQGRVLGDRSVLFKYANPNLVAVTTLSNDPMHKYVLNIYLVDVVSGLVIFSVSHKRVKPPFHLVHSENFLAYSYFNDKMRRTEISSLELYEGKEQTNSTAFSSLAPPCLPLVERQSYIMPAMIETMKETITEKGITSKHILMALSSGAILEMPWMLLDTRRTFIAPTEEGVLPYIPELPMMYEGIINYNQSIARPRGIHTVPSGLESTCLVFVYGLDIFYTRVSPSNTFDVLKEDFDHYLITMVLVALTLASYITRQFASRKALKQAWK